MKHNLTNLIYDQLNDLWAKDLPPMNFDEIKNRARELSIKCDNLFTVMNENQQKINELIKNIETKKK